MKNTFLQTHLLEFLHGGTKKITQKQYLFEKI